METIPPEVATEGPIETETYVSGTAAVDDTGEPAPECSISPEGDGLVWQCNGYGTRQFTYDNLVDPGLVAVPASPVVRLFGQNAGNDPYADPDVMACCNGIELAIPFDENPQYTVCHADFMSFACNSVQYLVQQAANLETDPGRVSDLNQLAADVGDANWREGCAQEIYMDGPDIPLGTAGVQYTYAVALPNTYANIANPVVDLAWAINGLYQPSGPGEEVGTCQWYGDNDGQIWTLGADDNSGWTLSPASAPDGTLLGPAYSTGTVTASASLDSSFDVLKLSFSTATSKWTVHSFALGTTEAVTVGNSTANVELEDFQIELLVPITNISGTLSKFTVPAHAAKFAVMGHGGGVPYALILDNTTPITFKPNAHGGYQHNSFGIQFVDPNNHTWNLTVAGTSWVP